MMKEVPSMDLWLKEAKEHKDSGKVGMYLTHQGVVRESPRSVVREDSQEERKVKAIDFSYDQAGVDQAVEAAYKLPGVYYIKAWLNEGRLEVGDPIMQVLIGGDIRPNTISALEKLVEKIKTLHVVESEILSE